MFHVEHPLNTLPKGRIWLLKPKAHSNPEGSKAEHWFHVKPL